MKKKNVVAILAIIAISAMPLMAHQLENYRIDENFAQEVGKIVTAEFTPQYHPQAKQHNKRDVNTAIKNLKTLLNDETLTDFVENQQSAENQIHALRAVKQNVFMAIDNLASAILNLPEEKQMSKVNEVRKTLKENKFIYLDKYVTLEELFDFSTDHIYYDGNSAIVKFLNKKFQCEHYYFHSTLVIGIDQKQPIE